MIAQCLAYGGYRSVYVSTGEDNDVKKYLRMRDDHKLALKKSSSRSIRFAGAMVNIMMARNGR